VISAPDNADCRHELDVEEFECARRPRRNRSSGKGFRIASGDTAMRFTAVALRIGQRSD
jgi:hypothetical protein